MAGFAQCGLRWDYVEGSSSSPVGYLEEFLYCPLIVDRAWQRRCWQNVRSGADKKGAARWGLIVRWKTVKAGIFIYTADFRGGAHHLLHQRFGALAMIAKQVHHPLAPVYDKDCRVLFLGTMPSPQSRADGFLLRTSPKSFLAGFGGDFWRADSRRNRGKAGFLSAPPYCFVGCAGILRNIRCCGRQHPRTESEFNRNSFTVCVY